MRKRTAWLCCISAVLVVAGYVGWCGRSFYLEARIRDAMKLPPEVNAILPPLLDSRNMRRPEAFEPREMIRYLCLPHESRSSAEIRIHEISQDLLFIVRDSWSGDQILYFIREDGKWRQTQEELIWN